MDTSISRRLTALEAALSSTTIPSFSEFAKMWKDADELSRSLYEAALCCPELAADIRHWNTIRDYLFRLDVNASEPFSLEELAADLRSDDIRKDY